MALRQGPANDKCRACGCTDTSACPEGCSWIEAKAAGDGGPLCSACFGLIPDVRWALREIARLLRKYGATATTARAMAKTSRQLNERVVARARRGER